MELDNDNDNDNLPLCIQEMLKSIDDKIKPLQDNFEELAKQLDSSDEYHEGLKEIGEQYTQVMDQIMSLYTERKGIMDNQFVMKYISSLQSEINSLKLEIQGMKQKN
jgi:prefoldin subunit 5